MCCFAPAWNLFRYPQTAHWVPWRSQGFPKRSLDGQTRQQEGILSQRFEYTKNTSMSLALGAKMAMEESRVYACRDNFWVPSRSSISSRGNPKSGKKHPRMVKNDNMGGAQSKTQLCLAFDFLNIAKIVPRTPRTFPKRQTKGSTRVPQDSINRIR